jgi:hypothetical protein
VPIHNATFETRQPLAHLIISNPLDPIPGPSNSLKSRPLEIPNATRRTFVAKRTVAA